MHIIMHVFLHTNPFVIYLLVAVTLLLESSGVPVVNNTLLLFVGALASLGHFNITLLIISSILGSISGACLAYYIGMLGGRRMLFRFASLFHIDAKKINVIDGWFQQSGMWMIFFSRMIPYVRPFACFPAGIAKMNFPRFFMAALTGSVIWCIALLSIGWSLGRRWHLAVYLMQQYTLPTIVGIVLLLVLYVLVMRRVKRILNARYRSAHT